LKREYNKTIIENENDYHLNWWRNAEKRVG